MSAKDDRLDLLGESIHTAFRKGSEHPSATKVWNAIHKMPAAEWRSVLDWIDWCLKESGVSIVVHREKKEPPRP